MTKQAIIDIGSNSMRLSVYETEGANFRILFKEKIMAGLAGYVEQGSLTDGGIRCAYEGLLAFREILDALGIEKTRVFATASLRNVQNTDEAVAAIERATGYSVDVLSGEQEADYGFLGAMQAVSVQRGAYVDIGGASTEVVTFHGGQAEAAISFGVGSLNLYKQCVKKIIPGEKSQKRIEAAIEAHIDDKKLFPFDKRSALVGVGGTARAVVKLAGKRLDLGDDCCRLTGSQFEDFCDFLLRGDQAAVSLILKHEPERIHTIMPGTLILRHIFRLFRSEELLVSKYGVREGYLCQRQWNTPTPKTGS
ncbi:MAG: hypothetical protein Q4F17_08525 [Eubacteriales bacterium]|nr:hypothetical protein [Eubacteriales bacterium]